MNVLKWLKSLISPGPEPKPKCPKCGHLAEYHLHACAAVITYTFSSELYKRIGTRTCKCDLSGNEVLLNLGLLEIK